MPAPIEYAVDYTTADGRTHTTTVCAMTATDAVLIMSPRRPNEAIAPTHRIVSARLHASPHALGHAAWLVAREHARNPWDEDTERGFVMVRDAVDHARNTLRLPEDPYVAGAYPLEDEGSALDTAYRIILEATPDELDRAILDSSVRVKRTV